MGGGLSREGVGAKTSVRPSKPRGISQDFCEISQGARREISVQFLAPVVIGSSKITSCEFGQELVGDTQKGYN